MLAVVPGCRRELTVALREVIKDEKTPIANKMTHTAKTLRSDPLAIDHGTSEICGPKQIEKNSINLESFFRVTGKLNKLHSGKVCNMQCK